MSDVVKKKGRGRRKFCYTMLTVSELSGRSIWTVRKDVREGRLDMNDLMAVSEYIRLHRGEYDRLDKHAPSFLKIKGG